MERRVKLRRHKCKTSKCVNENVVQVSATLELTCCHETRKVYRKSHVDGFNFASDDCCHVGIDVVDKETFASICQHF